MRTVTAMVALDTVELLAERVCNLLAHGRRISMTDRYLHSDRPPALTVGLVLDAEPRLLRHADGSASFGVQLAPGLTAGFGFAAHAFCGGEYDGDAGTEVRAWDRWHAGAGRRYDLTKVDIVGGLAGDGPGRDDGLVIQRWNSEGVCREWVIGFDYGRLDGDPMTVVLCGSTRFYDAFQQANYDLTMAGHIVLSVGFYPHAKAQHGHGEGVGHDSAEKVRLDELHLRKIDRADWVYVLDCDVEGRPYTGASTAREIEYAERLGKPVEYLSREQAGAPS